MGPGFFAAAFASRDGCSRGVSSESVPSNSSVACVNGSTGPSSGGATSPSVEGGGQRVAALTQQADETEQVFQETHLRVLVLGDAASGKSCLLQFLCDRAGDLAAVAELQSRVASRRGDETGGSRSLGAPTPSCTSSLSPCLSVSPAGSTLRCPTEDSARLGSLSPASSTLSDVPIPPLFGQDGAGCSGTEFTDSAFLILPDVATQTPDEEGASLVQLRLEDDAAPSCVSRYRWTCGVEVFILRCTDHRGRRWLVEFWEVGGTIRGKAVRAVLYAQTFDGVCLAFDGTSEESAKALPCWLLELCVRAGRLPSSVFFASAGGSSTDARSSLFGEGRDSAAFELSRCLGDDVEEQSVAGGGAWAWRLRRGMCPVLLVATKVDKGVAPRALRRLWRPTECFWRDPGILSRAIGGIDAVERSVWNADPQLTAQVASPRFPSAPQSDCPELRQLVCSLMNSAGVISTSAPMGVVDALGLFAFLERCHSCKTAGMAQ